ncbi:TPA: class IIb bacteriocin, lactobin A/cerein 7B family [Streptococcus suis]|uniref:class IIb bacteriocin, lactobin A/cerein 7B family n=1 Tax=Streptococcus suis TaxID=1307 RepID=UPI001639688A|nr:class IIb bacteriocin, lactobin A/cerein 7B family [Streptococcus suis]HEL1564579.1 class IIb bacteriocin, lactobin A/cerein 7B family [Streptococcus suis]
MTKFETMDNMNTNFVALSDQDLVDMEGGSFVGAVLIIGGGLTLVSGGVFAVGAVDGYNQAKAKRKGY